MLYLLDTNALIELLRKPQSTIAARIRSYPLRDVALPTIALHELYFGAYKSSMPEQNLSEVDNLQFSFLPFDREDARKAAEIRLLLRSAGLPIGHYDILIAGQALARDLVLVTHNVREFARVPNLRVEDWQA